MHFRATFNMVIHFIEQPEIKGKVAIDMPRLTIHGLRHTSATFAAWLGATLAELQARIGNSTPNMAMRYQHASAERDAQLAARMSAFATGVEPAVDDGACSREFVRRPCLRRAPP